MRVQFNGQPAFDSNTMWGYTVEVTPEGVFGEVPDELVESEAGAGRVKVPAKVAKTEAVKAEAVKAEYATVVEEPKRAGRPPKAAE